MAKIQISPFIYYMSGQGLWFVISGIQMVLIPAIGLLVLGIEPRQLGLAQAAGMAPSIALLLFGGLASERNDARVILSLAQFLAVMPPVILVISLWMEALTFGIYLLSIILMGSMSAFIIPARDTLLSRVAKKGIQKTVTTAIMIQFIGMLSGIALVSTSVYVGFLPVVILQCVFCFICGIIALGLPRQKPKPAGEDSTRLKEIAEGFRLTWEMKDIFSVTMLMAAIGVFYIGAFIVLLPLLTHHTYGGDAGDLSIIQTAFWLGTILITLMMSRTKMIVHRGRFLVGAIFAGAGVLFVLALTPAFWIVCAAVFVWGIGAGISMSMTRTVVQEEAPETHRARLLSIYTLSFMGGAPIGAYVMGELAQRFSLEYVLLVPAIGMVVLMICLIAFTPLWKITAVEAPIEEDSLEELPAEL